MKNNIHSAYSLLLLLLFFGCKKESLQIGTCQLTSWQGLDDGYLRALHYNSDGLLDQWRETSSQFDFDQLSTYEYSNKRVTKMKFYDHGNFLYTVILVYKGSQVTKERWYIKDTETLDDELVNTYNARGLIVKRQSLNYHYYAVFTYDIIGNIIKTDVLAEDGSLIASDTLAYNTPIREPMDAVPGLPYPIQYVNYMISKLKFTYYKQIYTDGLGGFVTGYELDPAKSTLRAGPELYAVYYNTFDKVSEMSNRQIWKFQNCSCADFSGIERSDSPSFNKDFSKSKMYRSPYISVKQMREQIKQSGKLKKQ